MSKLRIPDDARVVLAMQDTYVAMTTVRPSLADARAYADGFASCADCEGTDYAVFVLPEDIGKLPAKVKTKVLQEAQFAVDHMNEEDA